MRKTVKIILKVIGILFLSILIVVGGYLAYAFGYYHRIPDMQELAVTVPKAQGLTEKLTSGEEYTAVTYNIGFGAYLPEFSFFMDGGESSWAKSKESVMSTVSGACVFVKDYDPDFVLLEEVDIDATRSYHVNQNDIIRTFFPTYYETEAINYDSPFLMYPLTQPHGKSLSEIAFLSKYPIESGMRRSLPISTSFSKMLDLDRCYSVSRVPVDNGKTLCIYTTHTSAYGMDASIREGQIGMLREDMEKELAAGNYVICGGDFNHDLKAKEGEQGAVEWACPLPRTRLAKGMRFVIDELSEEERLAMPDSARNTDIPYKEGVTFTVTLDGFMVSDNISVTSYMVANGGFKYSDHEPVIMRFVLE